MKRLTEEAMELFRGLCVDIAAIRRLLEDEHPAGEGRKWGPRGN